MLFDDLKKAKMAAMKEHNKVKSDTLGVAIAKAMLVNTEKKAKGEELTDAEMIGILQKTVKELEEEKANYMQLSRSDDAANVDAQIDYIKEYLPAMMNDDEIRNIILGMEDKSVGTVMKTFKAKYAGQADMKKVQEILKSL
ncbi:MAG: GatB/YqeY domain-containing protein [Spirochaetales bacterium]|nr:GatB/YqeY domain-containing protein [Spirochaetales bacterium]MBR6061034.1 GatB/YqeY domain-containing protein [Spirochaetales bacterium]